MSRTVDSIISDVLKGTSEERVMALDEYIQQSTDILVAAAKALEADEVTRFSVTERVAELMNRVRRTFVPVFASTTNPEVKILSAVLAARAGSREAIVWLLGVAGTPGPDREFATRQLASLHVTEVRDAILDQLRSIDARRLPSMDLRECGQIADLLDSWARFGEPLPEDVSTKLKADDVPRAVKATLESLKL